MKTVVAGALGECVHVAGVMSFLRLAEAAGWRTVFLGPAVPVEQFVEAARRERADLVGVSARLTPETGERLLGEFAEAADDLHAAGVRFVFGGTPPVVERAQAFGFFARCFDGDEPADAVLAYLKGQDRIDLIEADYPQTIVERIAWKSPFPLVRHHFGLPSMEATREGIARIAEAGVLDVISLGIDQDAQANFFHPERQVGEHDLAQSLLEKTLALIMSQPGIHEYYDAQTGDPPTTAADAFGWTAAVFIDLAIQVSGQGAI